MAWPVRDRRKKHQKTFIPLEIAVDMKFMTRVYLNEYLINTN